MLTDKLLGGSEGLVTKMRPEKQISQIVSPHRSYGNTTPKPTPGRACYHNHGNTRALSRNHSARVEAFESLGSPPSKSLLELLPTHVNNPTGAVSLVGSDNTLASPDAGVFYSFERKEAPGGPVDLGDLVERAERRWEGQKTERLVRGEWEVLDQEGESVRLKGKRGSPKVKAAWVEKELVVEDGFEMI